VVGDDDLVPVPSAGRVYRARRRVRLGDVDPSGRLRLDALARYLQDVSNDDTHDAGLGDAGVWVVRRTVLAVHAWPRPREELELATFCSGVGLRWAERRISVVGEAGGHVEAATLWIHLDDAGTRPARLPASFHAVYDEAAGGRSVTPRLTHGEPGDGVTWRPWPLRATDFDPMRHVNNAAYWAAAEELLADGPVPGALRAEMEFRRAIEPGEAVVLGVRRGGGEGLDVAAWLAPDPTVGDVYATCTLLGRARA